MRHFIICFIIISLHTTISLADTITLKNGYSVEGVIVDEDDKQVVFNVGYGTITFLLSDIESISKAGQSDNAELIGTWRKEYIENFPAPTPKGQKLLDGFKDLVYKGRALSKSTHKKRDITQNISAAKKEMAQLQYKQDELTVALKKMDAQAASNIGQYNALVAECNLTTNKLKKLTEDLDGFYSKQGKINEDITEYINLFLRYKGQLEERHQELLSSGKMNLQQKEFYQSLNAKSAELEKSFTRSEIECTRKGKGLLVYATLNNTIETALIVDTGAESTMISEDTAKKLGIDFDACKKDLNLILADGSKIKAKTVVLDSVKVGSVEANDVDVAIIRTDSTRMQHGLLGMSFLRNFSFNINFEKQKIIFDSFKD